MENITKKEQEIALISLKSLSEMSKNLIGQQEIHLLDEQSKQLLIIPAKAFFLLQSIVVAMSENKNVSLLESEKEMTTQQAADLLQISRPYLIKLLGKNEIPYKNVGKHRRILVSDVLVYQEKQEQKQREKARKNLDFLAKHAQKFNLGY